MRLKSGMSLLEIIIVFSVIALMTAITLPSYVRFQKVNDLQLAFNFTVNNFINAQLKAMAGERDSQWGVRIEGVIGGRIIIFKGNNYASRDSSFDETTELPKSVSHSGNLDIYFNKLTGYPSASSTILFSDNLGQTKQFYLNEKGGLEY